MRTRIRSVAVFLSIFVFCAAAPSAADAAWIASGDSWYSATDAQVTALAAEGAAQVFGGHLVTIGDTTEQQWLTANFNDEVYWIGLSDAGQEGIFRWMDGAALTYANWHPGEPNDFLGGEDYVVMNWNLPGAWNDEDGSDLNYGILEVANGSPVAAVAPTAPITFGDEAVFDASASFDPNFGFGDYISAYDWTINGLPLASPGPWLQFDTTTLGGGGYFPGVLRVTDRLGAQTSYEFVFEVSAVTPVPEPTGIALLGTGLLGLCGYQFRRRSQYESA